MPRAATSGYANRRTRRRLLDYTPLSRGSCYVAEVSVASYSHPALWIAANTAYIDSGHISTRDSGSLKGAAVDNGLYVSLLTTDSNRSKTLVERDICDRHFLRDFGAAGVALRWRTVTTPRLRAAGATKPSEAQRLRGYRHLAS